MSLGLYERRHHRRRQFWVGFTKWLLAFLAVLAAGGYAAYIGRDVARLDVSRLEEEIRVIQEQKQALEAARDRLEAQVRTAVERAKEWEGQYRRDVPDGEMRAFLKLVEEKLADGLESQRLAFLIDAAAPPRDCVGEPESKRFIVRTLLETGANDSVTFGRNRVTVTAKGAPALNDAGQKEAWFDAAQPITATFTHISGVSDQAVGYLPLTHALIAEGQEFRFTLRPGPQGFLRVSGQTCAYP